MMKMRLQDERTFDLRLFGQSDMRHESGSDEFARCTNSCFAGLLDDTLGDEDFELLCLIAQPVSRHVDFDNALPDNSTAGPNLCTARRSG
jgi:hypothetical protein